MSMNSPRPTPQHNFAQIPSAQIQRSKFDRSFTYKTTFDRGNLIPVFLDEILPGDVVSLSLTAVARMLTPLSTPMMDNLYLDFQFYFVPCRLVWGNWQRFLGAQDNPDDSTDYSIPVIDIASMVDGHVGIGDVADYMGLPAGDLVTYPIGTNISALPFRAYNLIFNEWYRDENLVVSAPVNLDDGPDAYIDACSSPLIRGKRHEYFSSSLPFAQKGDAVTIPIGAAAPVIGNGLGLGLWGYDASSPSDTNYMYFSDISGAGGLSTSPIPPAIHGSPIILAGIPASQGVVGVTSDPSKSGLFADLTSATSITINQLRLSVVMQQILEANARGGTRYTELIQAQFGVHPEDFRLQRPEYLGGSSGPLLVATVPQTSQSDTTPQGTLTAYVAGKANAGFHHSFLEHGYLIGIASVRADLTWQNQLAKLWSRSTVWDFWRPQFAGLGEQAVLSQEMSFTSSLTDNQLVFGYQEFGAEYRYKPNMVTCYFRSNSYITTGSLDSWHLAYDFGPTLVPLNELFILELPPVERIIAVDGVANTQFLLDVAYNFQHTRPMPMYSVPGLRRF